MHNRNSYDYIVVGAGSAGCAAAYRLAVESDAQVLLIEAGGGDHSPLVKIPIGFAAMVGEGKANWNYRSQPEPALGGRRIPVPRGRLLGGCSSINGMVYIRGQREDYDAWAAAGNSGWSFDELLPLFKRSENYWKGADKYHGTGGRLEVSRRLQRFAVGDAFIDAAVDAGIPANDDFNGAHQEGVGYFDATIAQGVRHSSARAFLRRGVKPHNLTVLTRFEVSRLCFDGKRAVAVEGFASGKHQKVECIQARREIILCSGAYNSPKLLELSGIGDAGRLQKLGIPVVADRPSVGEHLQDHCNSYLFYAGGSGATYYDHLQPRRLPLTVLQYLFLRRGIFANPAAQVGVFLRLDDASVRPDVQVHFAAAASSANSRGKLSPAPGVCASVCLLQPHSRGSTHITSSQHAQAPAIHFNYLSDSRDRDNQAKAVRRLRDIFTRPALDGLIGGEMPPLAGLHTDEHLQQGIQDTLESVHHPVGTCRMGIDAEAVVDPRLRVIGVDGLRVADASIMPRIVSGNTHAACVMIGEKLADLVLQKG